MMDFKSNTKIDKKANTIMESINNVTMWNKESNSSALLCNGKLGLYRQWSIWGIAYQEQPW